MTLMDIYYNINLYFTPIMIVFGVIGNIFSILIFTRPTLRRSCSVYFLAGSVNGLIILLFGAMTRWLADGFSHLDPTRTSLSFCRFRSYIVYVIYNLAPYFTACITIDRFCSSCTNPNIRRLSSRVRIAYTVVPIVILITLIAYIHMVIRFTIVNSVCRPEMGSYAAFFPIFTTGYYFFGIVIIVIFGLGTSYNIRSQQRRIQPIIILTTAVERRRARGDTQLLLILLIHVICYASLALPYHISLIVGAVKPTLAVNTTFRFIQQMAIITLNLSQSVSFGFFFFIKNLLKRVLIFI
jgi:hypothetical protein